MIYIYIYILLVMYKSMSALGDGKKANFNFQIYRFVFCERLFGVYWNTDQWSQPKCTQFIRWWCDNIK